MYVMRYLDTNGDDLAPTLPGRHMQSGPQGEMAGHEMQKPRDGANRGGAQCAWPDCLEGWFRPACHKLQSLRGKGL